MDIPTVALRCLLLVSAALQNARFCSALPSQPTVSHGGGSVLGARLVSAGTREGVAPRQYAAFWGVPYARPPVGELRFKPPVRVGFPVGLLQATNSSHAPCLQQRRDPPTVLGSEDCLSLHIFTPYLDGPDLPVVVFFHGGGFMYGAGPRTGQQYLMDYDVVFVSLDYRLGILGFLSFDDAEMPGNTGMLDQAAALQWVQENIQYFGGNNRSVTIAGLSAGSASCLLHTMSPISRGLFHRVIGVSGSPLNPWTQQHSARGNALRVAALANCSFSSTAESLGCLRGKDALQLVALQAQHFQYWMQNPFSPFAPVVDNSSATPFLPRDPQDLLASGRGVADVPLLLSLTTDEGLYNAGEFVNNASLLRELDDAWETVAPLLLHFHDGRVPEDKKAVWARDIRQHYLGNASLSSAVPELVQLMGDRNFVVGAAEHALRRAAVQSSPVHFYRFGYRGQYSLYNDVHTGVSHADDVQYVLGFSRWSGPFSRQGDVQMQKSLLQMWTSFILNGTPEVDGAAWAPLPKDDTGSLHYLQISNYTHMTMENDTDLGHKTFWKCLDDTIHSSYSGSCQIVPFLLLYLVSFSLLRTFQL